MATGGMGDVLSGVAGALCGQIQDLHQATVLAACAHLAAADHASRHRGYMGLAPTDVIEALPEVFRRLETDRASAGERT
jgi:NAD(P)H-hydrate epimerase